MSTPHIEQYLKLADSKSLEVLFWLLHNRDSENLIHTTLENVAAECDVTKVTVNRVFQRLYKEEFLTKVRNGKYQLHKV
jgi:predicted transcriptional regulator